jgi:N,N'-diacetyllegionaminate synthase
MREVPLLIYEVANVHGGDPAEVFALIEALAPQAYPRRGMKFHPISADALAVPDFPTYPVYQQLQFDSPTWARIIERAAERIGSVWVEMADAHCARVFRENKGRVAGVKFQASMVDNREVLADFAKTQGDDPVAVMVNVSGYDLAELEDVVARMRALPHRRFVLQIGFQDYPTRLSDTLFNKIAVLRARFPDVPLAFADHVEGSQAMARRVPLIAAALGCDIVEKHVCRARAAARYDGWSALEPGEIGDLQGELEAIPALFGERYVAPAERLYLEKSLVKPLAAKKLPKGRFVDASDVVFRRSAQDGLTYAAVSDLQTRQRMVAAADIEAGRSLTGESFRKARIGAIVACRMKSSRLPRKAELQIEGKASVERCLEGLLQIPGVSLVCLATSTHEDDAVLGRYTLGGKVLFHRGDPDDVVRRYLDVCDAQDLDVVCRVTGDCPTLSAEVIAFLLDKHFAAGADFTRARREAIGTGAHIINVEAMRRVLTLKGSAPFSEYMNLYFENNPEHFRISIVDLPDEFIRDYRLTLDHPEDLTMFRAVFAELARRGESPNIRSIFRVLDERPDIAAINSDLMPKYKVDTALIQTLNRETRITAPASLET